MHLTTPPSDAGELPSEESLTLLNLTPEEESSWIEGLAKEILTLLATEPALKQEMRLIETGAMFSSLPAGYKTFKTKRGNKSSKTNDKYIYGHPSGGKFRSRREFSHHLFHLMLKQQQPEHVCQCVCCSKKSSKSSSSSAPSSGTSDTPASSTKAPLSSIEKMRRIIRQKKVLQSKEAANDGPMKYSVTSVSPSMASKSSEEVAPSSSAPPETAIEIKSDKKGATAAAALEKADAQNSTEMDSDQEDAIPLSQIYRSKSNESLPTELPIKPATERETDLKYKEAVPAVSCIKSETIADLAQISQPRLESNNESESIPDEAHEKLMSSTESEIQIAPLVPSSSSANALSSPQIIKKYSVNLKHMNIVRQSTEGKDAWSEHTTAIASTSSTATTPSATDTKTSLSPLKSSSESKSASTDQYSGAQRAIVVRRDEMPPVSAVARSCAKCKTTISAFWRHLESFELCDSCYRVALKRQKKRLMKEQEDAKKAAEGSNPAFTATHSENYSVPVIDSRPEKAVSNSQTGEPMMPSRNPSTDSAGSVSLPVRRSDDRGIEHGKRPGEFSGGDRKKVKMDFTQTASAALLASVTMKESQAWSAPMFGETKHSGERSLFVETSTVDSATGPTFLPAPSNPSSPLGTPSVVSMSSKEQANLILNVGSSVGGRTTEPIPPTKPLSNEENHQAGIGSDVQDTGIQNSFFLETFQAINLESAETSNETRAAELINIVPEKPRLPEIQEDFARNALNVLKGILNSDYAPVPTRMIEAAVLNSVAHAQHTFSAGQMVWTPAVISPMSRNFNLIANVKPANGPSKSIELDMKPFVHKSVSWPAIVKCVRHNVQELVDADPACRIWEDPIVIDDLGDDMLALSQFEDSDYGTVKACQSGNIAYEIELFGFPEFPIFMEGRFLKTADEIHVPGQYVLGLDGLDWEESVEFKHLDGSGNVSLVYELYVKSLNEAKAHQSD
ncbi:hypothetical protein BJ741DRAFT_629613 [Chytriomyces cf. hyalinus JEL632]|nr:hypothetical protein BJ741DRAFT_629613 [Chytriomyces cf. hyalinus JEL632]